MIVLKVVFGCSNNNAYQIREDFSLESLTEFSYVEKKISIQV